MKEYEYHGVRKTIQRCLWMVLYLQRYGKINPVIAKEHLGISTRTYWRYMREIQEAGVILATNPPEKGATYMGFDPVMAPVRDAV